MYAYIHNPYNLFILTIDYSKIHHMEMFVVKSIYIQINGLVIISLSI